MKYAIFLTFLISFIFQPKVNAQNLVADSLYEIETMEGNKYTGQFVGMEGNIFSFQSKELGSIKLKPEQIKHCFLIEKDQVRNGKIWPANIHPSRYFFAPSGYGLKQGEGYYQNIWILFNQVSYGLSDNLTIGVGTIPFFLFKGGSVAPIWITPKISVPISNTNIQIGCGAFLISALGSDYSVVGTLYGTVSYGNTNYNASLNVGYGYGNGEFSSYPIVNFSSMLRISKKSFFIFEGYNFGFLQNNIAKNTDNTGSPLFTLFGFRKMGKKIAFDYGLMGLWNLGQNANLLPGFVPWLGISVPFGKFRKNEIFISGIK